LRSLSGKKILIGPSSFAATDSAPMDRLRESGCEIMGNPFKRKLTKPELIDLLGHGVSGLIAGLEPLDREVLEASGLEVISRCGAGLSNIDLTAARGLGIAVCFTPDAPTKAVAELTVGALLGMLRMIPQMNRDLHDGRWIKRIGTQLEKKTVVIIGFGRIGRYTAKLLAPFGVKLLIVDPYFDKTAKGVKVVSLEEAIPPADVIIIHASGENCILRKKEFTLMKKGIFLLNAARGNAVDEDALVDALEKKTVKGAWIDVFKNEPYNGELRKYPQAILTPHEGSYTGECRRQMEIQAVDNLIRAFEENKKNEY